MFSYRKGDVFQVRVFRQDVPLKVADMGTLFNLKLYLLEGMADGARVSRVFTESQLDAIRRKDLEQGRQRGFGVGRG